MLWAIVAPVFQSARFAVRQTRRRELLKSDLGALILYTQDNDDRFPRDMSTGTAIQRFVAKYSVPDYAGQPRHFQAASEEGEPVLGNPRLAKRSTDDLADWGKTVALYLRSSDWPHEGTAADCDGHVSGTRYNEIEQQLAVNPFLAPAAHQPQGSKSTKPK